MKKGYLYIIFATILFSTMEIALKLVTNQFHPIQLTFLRFLIGALILYPLALKNLKTNHLSLTIRDYGFFALLGCICVVISMTFYQMAILYSKASIVAILFSCNPVFVIPFAFFMLHEKVHWHTILSMIISILGIVCILNPWNITGNPYGILFTFLSAITFAFYGVGGKKKSAQYGSVVSSCFCFLLGSLEMLILILITKLHIVANWLISAGWQQFANIPILSGISWNSIPSLIYIGIFVTGLGYTFYFLAMEKTSAAVASLVFYIKPSLAPILALMILHESITLTTIIGTIFIIIGSCISFIANRKQTKNLPDEAHSTLLTDQN